MTPTTLPVVAVAPFGKTRKDQHLVDDDNWYFGFLKTTVPALTYIAGSFSGLALQSKYQETPDHKVIATPSGKGRISYEWALLRSIRRSLNNNPDALVIFFGYSESLLLGYWALNFWRLNQIILVNTNNISPGRILRHGRKQRIILWLIQKRLRKFLVHTNFEAELSKKYFEFLAPHVSVKKHHLMVSKAEPNQTIANSETNECLISCFGPLSADKSAQSIGELINKIHLTGTRFKKICFKLYRISKDDVLPYLDDAEALRNVVFHDGFLTKDAYTEAFRESDLVVMNHTQKFEGKLSGILCDCIALGIPYLSTRIEPLMEMQARFGDIGYIYDIGNSGWLDIFLSEFTPKTLAERKKAIGQTQKAYTKEVIDADYLNAFFDI